MRAGKDSGHQAYPDFTHSKRRECGPLLKEVQRWRTTASVPQELYIERLPGPGFWEHAGWELSMVLKQFSSKEDFNLFSEVLS